MKKFRKIFLFGLAVLPLCMAAAAQANAYTIFVSNEKDDTVSVVDGASLKLIKTIDIGHRPRGIIITPDNKTIVVCLGDDGQIAMIDANTFQVTRKLNSGSDPELLNISHDGKISTSLTRMTVLSRSWTSRLAIPLRKCRSASSLKAWR